MRSTTRLRQMLAEPGIIVAPGAYDGFSARLIEAAGFRAVYMTGAGTAASHLGQPDLGLATLTEMATHAGHLASCVSLPVIADADTGYGNALNVVRTVREYERAGVAGLHIEDQVAPKKCGHIAGKQVIPTREFADKIRAAAEHRTDPDFVIIARTDARAVTEPRRRHRARQPLRGGGRGRDLRRGAADRGRDPPHRPRGEGAAPRQHGGGRPHARGEGVRAGAHRLQDRHLPRRVHGARPCPPWSARCACCGSAGPTGTRAPCSSPMDIFRKVGFDWWQDIERRYTGS